MTEADTRYRAPALDKGLDILEFLAHQPTGLTRAEIVKAMGRSPSEIYRMLERLVARDYVSRSAEGDRYSLTMKLFYLGNQHPPLSRLIQQAAPLMHEFAQDVQQSLHLVAPSQGRALVIYQVSSPGNWEFRLRTGAELDFLTTGSGLTLLACRPDDQRHDLLATQPDADAQHKDLSPLISELDQVREQGYRLAASTQLEGVQDISVPILSPDQAAIAVFTCPFVRRLDQPHRIRAKATLEKLQIVAQRLSLQ